MSDRRCADPAFGADHGDRSANRLGVRGTVQRRNRSDDVEHADRPDQVVADSAADELAIEQNVVGQPDHDHPRPGVAYFRELVEPGKQLATVAVRLDDDHVGGRRVAVGLGGRRDAAHLDFQMSFGHATILARRLHGGSVFGGFAERLDRDARNRSDMRRPCGLLRRVVGLASFESGKCDHWPISLTLPLLASGLTVAVGSPLRYFSSTVERRAANVAVSPRGWIRSAGYSTIAAKFR